MCTHTGTPADSTSGKGRISAVPAEEGDDVDESRSGILDLYPEDSEELWGVAG